MKRTEEGVKRGFGSDNHSGAHPQIIQALIDANVGHAPSYGTDLWTEKWNDIVKKIFGAEATSFFVFNGTAANVLSIGGFIQSHH
ncbi:MAG: beta-eliminating lyase-related protein, partial [Bdellovibrionota bacterium]